MLLYQGLVLVKVLGNHPDVFKVDSNTPNHRECPRTSAIDELNDDSTFVVDGVINQLALEVLFQGKRGHRNIFDHVFRHFVQEWGF